MTLPRPDLPPEGTAGSVPAGTAPHPPVVIVDDQDERRIRKPVDLLRFVIGCAGVAVLAGIGLVADATATGAETDLVAASHRLPGALLGLLGSGAALALLLLPVALAVRLLARRQSQWLAEAVATAAAAVAIVVALNELLRRPEAVRLYAALTVARPGHADTAPIDIYLAALVAYVTVIGLTGRPRWRTAVWLALGVYAVASLAALHTTVLSLLVTLLLGRTIGVGVRYAAGIRSQRPSAEQIAVALSSVGLPLTQLRRLADYRSVVRRYAATTGDGSRLDVTVFDRDQDAAGALYRFYRRLRLDRQVSRGAPLSLDRAIERRALLSYAAADAGVRAPKLRAVVRIGPEAAALAYDHEKGTRLEHLRATLTEAQMRRIWNAVLRLHARRVTHRALTADRILIADDGDVVLLDLADGDVAASDLQLRLDLAQLLAEFGLLVGPERAANAALAEVGPATLAAALPLLQPVALYRSTRIAVRHSRDVLPALRQRLLAAAPNGKVPPVRLERIRPRTLISLVAGVFAAYLLAGQLARVNLASVMRHADWRWTLLAVAVSALTYAAAATSLSGFVVERLIFARTLLAQVAASFVTLVTPAAVGGAALNIRYLQRSGVSPAKATASVGAAQVIAFVLHMLLLVIFAAITGAAQIHSLRPPTWAYLVLAGLVILVLTAVAIRPGRRLLRARLAPTLGQVLPRLLDLAQNPRKLAEGLGGAILLTLAYVICLTASVRALGGSVPIASVAVVYLTGNALGSAAPTPGGLGAVEVALSAGLSAAGLASATALSAVLLFRLLTFWLPVPVGWLAFNYLQRRQAL